MAKRFPSSSDSRMVNKIDTLDTDLRDRLVAAIGEEFPRAEVFCVSAKTGAGLDAWFDFILESESGDGTNLELDYDTYAEGEALLGWLNTTIRLEAKKPFDANAALLDFARDLRDRIAKEGREIAHLKMTLDPGDATGTLSAVSLVSSDGEPDLRESFLEQVDGGTLIVNLRAEAEPEFLEKTTREALDAWVDRIGLRANVEHRESFRPARPVPTHRMEGRRE